MSTIPGGRKVGPLQVSRSTLRAWPNIKALVHFSSWQEYGGYEDGGCIGDDFVIVSRSVAKALGLQPCSRCKRFLRNGAAA